MSLRITLTALAVLTAASLAGCGKMGALDRPGPLFGKGDPKIQGASPTKRAGPDDPSRPVQTVDPRDRDVQLSPGPQRSDPIAGTDDPTRAGPSGSLPDPFQNPK